MAQWDNQQLIRHGSAEDPGSTPGSSCFSLVFINNLINDKSKHKKQNVTICFVLSLTVIYNMYTSMNS